MSAFLGAIVTAVITLILLNGQSLAEELKEKNVKVFEKKSLLFENFNNKLNEIINKQELSANDFIKIKSEYYTNLMFYLKEKSQIKIINYLAILGKCVGISINDRTYDLETINRSHEIIKENIYNIINVLTEEIGLGGKINISFQKELDNNVFPNLFKELLLEEVNNIFSKEKIFNKACYQVIANGTFIVLNLNGKLTDIGGIHIGPLFNYTANENFPALDGIYFRFCAPTMNPVSELYTVKEGTNLDKTLIDFNGNEKGLINLQNRLAPWAFKEINIDANIFNQELQAIRFDDINTFKYYSGVYIEVAKAIAIRSYFHFLNAKTKNDNLTIKELYEKFESVPFDQYVEHTIKVLTTPKDFSK
jgi:hypothetical protein